MNIDEEKVRQAIEVSQNGFPQVTGWLRLFLLGVIIAFFVFGAIMYLPFIPKMGNVLVMNPVGDKVVRVTVWGLTVFAVLGILCIFLKPVRLPTAIVFGVYLLGFCILAEINDTYKRIDWDLHKNSNRELRECVITLRKVACSGATYTGEDLARFDYEGEYYQSNFYLTVRFTDNNEEYEFLSHGRSLPLFNRVREGRKYNAKMVRGTMKLKYIVGFEPIVE